jgi:hypothetical protein
MRPRGWQRGGRRKAATLRVSVSVSVYRCGHTALAATRRGDSRVQVNTLDMNRDATLLPSRRKQDIGASGNSHEEHFQLIGPVPTFGASTRSLARSAARQKMLLAGIRPFRPRKFRDSITLAAGYLAVFTRSPIARMQTGPVPAGTMRQSRPRRAAGPRR